MILPFRFVSKILNNTAAQIDEITNEFYRKSAVRRA